MLGSRAELRVATLFEGPMRIIFRVVAVVLVLVAALLIYAVIAAVTSDEGARVGVSIAYILGAIVAIAAAAALWRRPARRATA